MTVGYTILSVREANPFGTAWIAQTAEGGEVAITLAPTKAEKLAWMNEWVATGGVIQPWAEPPAPPQKRDLEKELDQLRAQLIVVEAKLPLEVTPK